jgi:hypothetical protein
MDDLEELDECVDECVDRETVVDLIHEIALSPKSKKDRENKNFSYTIETDTSEESDSVAIMKGSWDQVREKKAVPHKQRRKAQLRKVKRLVV